MEKLLGFRPALYKENKETETEIGIGMSGKIVKEVDLMHGRSGMDGGPSRRRINSILWTDASFIISEKMQSGRSIASSN